MWYAASVSPLRFTLLSAAGLGQAVPLYELALSTAPDELRARRLGPVGQVLRDFLLAWEASQRSDLRDGGGLCKAVGRLLLCAESVGASPKLLLRATQRLQEPPTTDEAEPQRAAQAGRIAAAASLLLRLSETYGRRAASDARLFAEGLRKLALHPLVEAAADIELVDLHLALVARDDGLGLPAWLAAIDCLAKTDRPLRIVLPSVDDRPPLQRALKPIFDSIYQRHELAIELSESGSLGPFAEGTTPWSRLIRSLFRPKSGGSLVSPLELADRVTLTPSAGPQAEAHAVAARVQNLLRGGVAAADIAVVAESAARRRRLTAALHRAGVPTTPLSGGVAGPQTRTAELPPPLRLICLLFEVLKLGLPREGFVQLLTSRYVRFPGPLGDKPWLVAQALRTAGVRTLRHPERSRPSTGNLWESARSEPTWGLCRLRTWLATQQKPASDDKPRSRPPHLPHLVEQVEQALHELTSLPSQATIADHCRALVRLLLRLHFFERCTTLPPLPEESEAESATLCMQLLDAHQRDSACVGVLSQCLDELPKWAARLGQATLDIGQREFAQLLRMTLGRLWNEVAEAPQPHAVSIGELAEIAPRTFAHLFIAGLIDGELPTFRPEDSLLPDEDRRLLDRFADRPTWPLVSQQNDAEPLKLAVALAHVEHAHLFWPLADEEGRPLPHSQFLDEICFAAAIPDDKLKLRPDPPATIHPTELWQRAPQHQSLFSALSRRERARANRLTSILRIEEQRSRFFSATIADADAANLYSHPFVGRLLDDSLITVLQPRLPGSPKHPLSASVLEDYARCPFRFFARRVLGIRPASEGSEELDPLASGRLHHAVLEHFFIERKESKRLPLRGDDADEAALDAAIQRVVSDFEQTEHIGNPALLKVRLGRLRAELWRLVKNEAAKPPEPGCLPTLFEWKFGPLSIASAQGDEGRMALHIHGIIDRVDIGGGKAVVLDYKAGRLDRYQAQLRDKLLKTSFQLPLYVAALRADPSLRESTPLQSVVARYYSLRQGKVSNSLDDAEMTTLLPEVRLRNPDGNVAEVAYRLWRRLRDGDFAVVPKTCEGCGLESVCRISSAPLDVPPEPSEETASSESQENPAPSQLSPTRDFDEGDGR